jgi:hypothetical protein
MSRQTFYCTRNCLCQGSIIRWYCITRDDNGKFIVGGIALHPCDQTNSSWRSSQTLADDISFLSRFLTGILSPLKLQLRHIFLLI